MASSRKMPWISRVAFAPAGIALFSAGQALASQGPGGGPGTASSFTQLAMAIIVYGTSALVVGAGLIGAARRRLLPDGSLAWHIWGQPTRPGPKK